MTYDDLVAAINRTTENEFETVDVDRFIRMTEQMIYNTIQPPALRKNQTGTLTAGNKYLTLPTDFISPNALAVVDLTGDVSYLLSKDVEYIREAFPVSMTDLPGYYALFDQNTILLGPTPDEDYTVEIHYFGYPDSIIDVGHTWLGDVFDNALVNGCLMEAIRFMKGEQDMVALYDGMFKESLGLLKNLADGKLRQDTYRTDQARVKVN